MERCGRRRALILCSVSFTAGWVTLTFATNHATILTARVMAGFSSGLTIWLTQVCFLHDFPPFCSTLNSAQHQATLVRGLDPLSQRHSATSLKARILTVVTIYSAKTSHQRRFSLQVSRYNISECCQRITINPVKTKKLIHIIYKHSVRTAVTGTNQRVLHGEIIAV